jgi:hypothetical protein
VRARRPTLNLRGNESAAADARFGRH